MEITLNAKAQWLQRNQKPFSWWSDRCKPPQNLFDSLTDRLEIANALKHLFGVIFVRQIGQYPKFKMISEKKYRQKFSSPECSYFKWLCRRFSLFWPVNFHMVCKHHVMRRNNMPYTRRNRRRQHHDEKEAKSKINGLSLCAGALVCVCALRWECV